MGFIWSQPESPLQASLLEEEPELILRTGDLLLVPASEVEISMDSDLWHKVAVVVHKHKRQFAFCDGRLEHISDFLGRFNQTVCRPLTCIREMGFDRRVLRAAERTMAILAKRQKMRPAFREGFCVATLLGILGLVSWRGLVQGKLRPSHFSVECKRLELKEHSSEQYRIMY